MVIFAAEESRRHGRSGNDQLRIGDPATGPCGTKAVFGEQEIRSGGVLIVRRFSGGVTLEARRGRAGKERASHTGFCGAQRLYLLRNEGLGLMRESFEEEHQGANLVVGEEESRHADLQIAAHAVAVQICGAQCRIGQEIL